MFTPALLHLLCCPTDRGDLEWKDETLVCTICKTSYPIVDGCAQLLPQDRFAHTTQYVEEAGAQILDYREISIPLLSAQVKNNMLNDFLRFGPGDTVLDLGCGNGKFAYWNKDKVARMLAVDVAPWFADPAREELALLRADLRVLPVRESVVDKVFSIDVLEHLTRDDIDCVLEETRRVLKRGGLFFVFSNTRERQTLAPLMAPQKAVTRWLTRHGAVDFTRDAWRKADHVKAIATFEEMEATFARHSFRVRQVAFWNGVFQGWIENVIVKLAERQLSRRARGATLLEQQVAARTDVRGAMRGRGGGKYRIPLEALSKIMSLDLALFGALRAGPYFVLLERA